MVDLSWSLHQDLTRLAFPSLPSFTTSCFFSLTPYLLHVIHISLFFPFLILLQLLILLLFPRLILVFLVPGFHFSHLPLLFRFLTSNFSSSFFTSTPQPFPSLLFLLHVLRLFVSPFTQQHCHSRANKIFLPIDTTLPISLLAFQVPVFYYSRLHIVGITKRTVYTGFSN